MVVVNGKRGIAAVFARLAYTVVDEFRGRRHALYIELIIADAVFFVEKMHALRGKIDVVVKIAETDRLLAARKKVAFELFTVYLGEKIGYHIALLAVTEHNGVVEGGLALLELFGDAL